MVEHILNLLKLTIIDKPILPLQLLRSTAPFITGIRIRTIIKKSGTTLRILFAEKIIKVSQYCKFYKSKRK